MEARERIFKMLEDGKINADEAAKLIEALNRSYHSPEAHFHGPRPPRHHRHPHRRIRRFRIPFAHAFAHAFAGEFENAFCHGFAHHGPKKIIVKLDDRCGDDGCHDADVEFLHDDRCD